MTPRFWHGRRVFLTGHTGFKGSWLSLWLQQLGAEVTGFALPPPTRPALFDQARVGQGMVSVIGDIREPGALAQALEAAAPEVVIHLAAQPLVRQSYRDPVGTYATNVMGTVHLLEAVRRCPAVRAVVNVTTDKCYENREWVWGYRESDPMGGHDPYSSSKGCAELVTAAYRRSYLGVEDGPGVGLASARAGNVIGGGDWAEDRLVPDMLAAFQAGRPAVIRNPKAVRPWQHVLEPLRGYLLLAEKLCESPAAHAQAWNFGPRAEDARTVGWVADKLARRWGDGARWTCDAGRHPHEAGHLALDISKAGRLLGWLPLLDLGEALALTVDWDRAQRRGADMRSYTQAQILAYQDRLRTPGH